MAFVYRSDRTNLLDKKKIALGPGEYNEELSKTQGRLLHKNHMKYSIIMKNSKPTIIPFNTTSKRSKLFEGDNIPGPLDQVHIPYQIILITHIQKLHLNMEDHL